MTREQMKKKLNKKYGKLGTNGKVQLSAEDFANQTMDQFDKDKRITGVHKLVLAMALMISNGLEPRVKMLRTGKLVQIKADAIKQALGFPPWATLIGVLEGIGCGGAVVRIHPGQSVVVDPKLVEEIL